jgi:hypothetical protein
VRPLLAVILVAALAGCGGGHKAATTPRATATTQKTAAAKIHVRLTGQSHHPLVGKRWHYEVRVTNAAGKPVPANVHLQFLYGGVPVGQVGRHHLANGVWGETFGAPGNPTFPAAARGQRLTLQAVATANGQTAKSGWWIVVR